MSEVPHYYLGNSGAQAWNAIEDYNLNYNKGCAWKYIVRAGRKTEDPTVDLQKAIHCLEREMQVYKATK